jgi:hypothetical protein
MVKKNPKNNLKKTQFNHKTPLQPPKCDFNRGGYCYNPFSHTRYECTPNNMKKCKYPNRNRKDGYVQELINTNDQPELLRFLLQIINTSIVTYNKKQNCVEIYLDFPSIEEQLEDADYQENGKGKRNRSKFFDFLGFGNCPPIP